MSTTEDPIDDTSSTALPTASDSTATVHKVNYTVDYIHESGPYTKNSRDGEKYLGFGLNIDAINNDSMVVSHFLIPARRGDYELKPPMANRLVSITRKVNTRYLDDHQQGVYTSKETVDDIVKEQMERFLKRQSKETGIHFGVGTSTDSFPNRQPRTGAYWISRDDTKGNTAASQGEVESSGLWSTVTGYFK